MTWFDDVFTEIGAGISVFLPFKKLSQVYWAFVMSNGGFGNDGERWLYHCLE